MPMQPETAEDAASVFEDEDDAIVDARLCQQVEDYIVQKPLKAMLIALVAGFFVSRIAF